MLRTRIPLPRFLSAGEVFAGKGSLGALRALDAARAAVLCSGSVLKHATFEEKIRSSVQAHEVKLIEAPSGEPSLAKLGAALAEISRFQPDWIIAVGGGSVIDAGKLLWILYEHPDADLEQSQRTYALRGKARFGAVPTTAGTGSEVSSSAIFTATDGGKQAVVSHDLLPDVVVLDPLLSVGVPRAVVAASGLDALSHAIEGYVSKFTNPLVDDFAETAARTLFRVLPGTFTDAENPDLRLEAMQAALMAGWVQNLKIPGVGHAIAHQLGRFGIAHGRACGALLAPSIAVNEADPIARRKYERLAERLGFSSVAGLRGAVEELRGKLGETESLGARVSGGRETVWTKLDTITKGALADICARANPRTVDRPLIEEVLNAAV